MIGMLKAVWLVVATSVRVNPRQSAVCLLETLGNSVQMLQPVLLELERLGVEHSLADTTSADHARQIARDAAAAGCLATGLRALNAVPAVNELPPGWVTALDLPLIPGVGTIR